MTEDDQAPRSGRVGGEGAAGWEATRADVARQLRTCLATDSPAATAVVTDVEGSAYRRPGARLVVTPAASTEGVTVDRLEGSAAASARAAIDDGESSIRTYDLTGDDDTWGMGLGLNGVVDVLVEPVDESLRPALDAMARKERAVVLTVLAVDGDAAVSPGDRTTLLEDGSRADEEAVERTDREPLPSGLLDAVEATVSADSAAALDSSTTVSTRFEGDDVSVFFEVYDPIPTLLVFGGMGDVGPVCRFARETGFRVEVVTGPDGETNSERFPAADRVRSVRPSELGEAVGAPEHTYVVLMSHDFRDDRRALASVLETAVPYVGLMGPRKRFEEMQAAVAGEGETLSPGERERLSTPVGLDLGADEPPQVAMSVVAEVLAVANGREGGRLSTLEGPIHDR